jgi:zinc/manganese transport system permease protein
MNDQLTWNLISDVRQLLAYQFMVNALRAGAIIAVTAGLVGWFMVLRRQTFAGHTLAVVGFPGASAAALVGVSAAYGYFAFAIVAALIIALARGNGSGTRHDQSAVIATVQALALASGFLFVSLSSRNITGVQSLLFGSFIGITNSQVITLMIGGLTTVAILGLIGRPLLFASVDPEVAAASGVPVDWLAVLVLVLVAVAAAEASQVTGSLLVFALLVLPAATAEVLVVRPAWSIALTVLLGVSVTWLALACAYYSDYPIGFFVTSLAFAAYLLAHGGRFAVRRIQAAGSGS